MSTYGPKTEGLSWSDPSVAFNSAAVNTTEGGTEQNKFTPGDAWAIISARPETSQAFIFSNKSGKLKLSTAGMAEIHENGDIEPSRHAKHMEILSGFFDEVVLQNRQQTDQAIFQTNCETVAKDHNNSHASWIYVGEAWTGPGLTVRISVLDPRSDTFFKGKTLLRNFGAKFGASKADTQSVRISQGSNTA